jgi:hypothetical protein
MFYEFCETSLLLGIMHNPVTGHIPLCLQHEDQKMVIWSNTTFTDKTNYFIFQCSHMFQHYN